MDTDEIWAEVDRLKTALAGTLDTLSDAQWSTPSLCDAWTVREVAAHLAIAPTITMGRAALEILRARGNFDRMIRATAQERAASRSNEQIVQDLRGTVGARRLAPSTKARDPLLDLLVHTQDIARPLALGIEMPAGPSVEALEWALRRGFPFHADRRFAGRRLRATDADWEHGAGDLLEATAGELLLMATGRVAVPIAK